MVATLFTAFLRVAGLVVFSSVLWLINVWKLYFLSCVLRAAFIGLEWRSSVEDEISIIRRAFGILVSMQYEAIDELVAFP